MLNKGGTDLLFNMNSDIRDYLMHTCTWCEKNISDGEGIFAFGFRANEALDLTGKEGSFVSLTLQLLDKPIVALVPTASSEARRMGYDLIFFTCSQACMDDLKEAIQHERDVFDKY